MILNPAQAKAVYDAMCALNNVGAIAQNIKFNQSIFVEVIEPNVIVTNYNMESDKRMEREFYNFQTSFFKAYNFE